MMKNANDNAADNANDNDATPNDDIAIHQKQSAVCPWGKLFFGLSLLAIILYVIIDSLTTKNISNVFQSLLLWMETHLIVGIFAFTLVYFAATVLFIPGSILTLGSGFVFGTLMGLGPGVALASGVVLVGASSGAVAR
jgi:uncharacterized membrane protein YdjX (TVP38/TMEM64 family)